MAFSDKLKDLREKKGLTQKELALELGVTPRIISYYETGKTFPNNPELLHKIVSLFNVTLDYLLLDTEKHTSSRLHQLVAKLKILTEKKEIIWKKFYETRLYSGVDSLGFPLFTSLDDLFDEQDFKELQDYNANYNESYFYYISGNEVITSEQANQNGYLLLSMQDKINQEINIALFACIDGKFKFISDMKHLESIEDLYILISQDDNDLNKFIDDFLKQ